MDYIIYVLFVYTKSFFVDGDGVYKFVRAYLEQACPILQTSMAIFSKSFLLGAGYKTC